MKRQTAKGVRFAVLLLILATAVALVACKGGKEKRDGEKDEQEGVSSGEVVPGGSVTVGITQDLDSLDPHNMAYAGTREVLFNVFEGLVKPDSTGELQPAVAEEFTISEDAKTYTFTLRDGVKFHNGNEVTAEDVKYSIERYADIQGEESVFSIMEEVSIPDGSTVEVRLSEGNSEFLAELTMGVMPKDYAEVDTNPMGTGPFAYEDYQPGEYLKVKKFAEYWLPERPYLDDVTFKIVTDTDAALLELQAGTLDVYQYLTNDQTDGLYSDFNILEGSVNYVQGLFLNNAYAPFDDVRVRQAMNYAVDKQGINDLLFGGKSHIIGTHMMPAFTKYYNAETEGVYGYDVERAKELLAEADCEDGFDLTIIVPNNYKPHAATAEVVVENLKAVGVRAKIEMVEFTTWYSDVYVERNFEATLVAVDGTLAPSSWMAKNESDSDNNFTNYKNEEFDKLFEEAKKTTNDEEKVEMYKELQMMLAEDAASVYLQDPANLLALNKKLTGYSFYPIAAQDMSTVGYIE